MSDFKNTEKKVEDNEVDWSEFLSEASETLLNPKNPILLHDAEQEVEAKYHCTLAKFACFIEAKNSTQKAIIQNRKKEHDGGYPWYHDSKRFIKDCLIANSFDPIYSGISYLKNKKPDPTKRYDVPNILHSKVALEEFLKVRFPLEFKQLKKELISPVVKSFRSGNIQLSLHGIYFFKGKFNGEHIIGGIMVNCIKTSMTTLQMQVASFLIKQYIEKHLLAEDSLCLPEFCICIDARNNKYLSAPKGSDVGKVRIAISKASQEFTDKWEEI